MVSLAQISLDPFCNSTHPTSSFLSPSIFLKKWKSKWTTTKKTNDDKTKQTEIKWPSKICELLFVLANYGWVLAQKYGWYVHWHSADKAVFPIPTVINYKQLVVQGAGISAPLCSEVFALHELSLYTSVYAASLFFKFICASVLFCLSSCSLISW